MKILSIVIFAMVVLSVTFEFVLQSYRYKEYLNMLSRLTRRVVDDSRNIECITERIVVLEEKLGKLPFDEIEENVNKQLALEKEWTTGMENILNYNADSVPKLNREGISRG